MKSVLLLSLIFTLISCGKSEQELDGDQSSSPPVSTAQASPTYNRVLPTLLSFSEAVNIASPSVINIFTTKQVIVPNSPLFRMFFEEFYGQELPQNNKQVQNSLGSGVIYRVDSKGVFIITNNHVVQDADDIVVDIDSSEYKAEVVGRDDFSDLALLKISGVKQNLKPITFAKSFEVGDVVLAIGNPFGVGKTVSQGIVSATERDSLGITRFENFIQTDAAINPGNSGGALVNSLGEMVGINTAIFSRSGGNQGIGFAIPFDIVGRIVKDLLENGKVEYPWAGLILQPLTENLLEALQLPKEQKGVLVSGTTPEGPANIAGVVAGDIIVEAGEQKISNIQELNTIITKQKIGNTLEVKVLRDKKEKALKIHLASRPKQ